MIDEDFQLLFDEIRNQNALLTRLCQIQEAMLILMADERDPDGETETYLNGKPKQ